MKTGRNKVLKTTLEEVLFSCLTEHLLSLRLTACLEPHQILQGIPAIVPGSQELPRSLKKKRAKTEMHITSHHIISHLRTINTFWGNLFWLLPI